MEIQSFTRSHNLISVSYLYMILLILPFHVCLADKNVDQKIEDQKIYYLIEQVKNSGAVFLRNGSEHKCGEAAEHLEGKMKRARRMFGFFGSMAPMSVEAFIDKIASKSSTSGKVYQIQFPNQKPMPTRTWLYEKLNLKFPKKKLKE